MDTAQTKIDHSRLQSILACPSGETAAEALARYQLALPLMADLNEDIVLFAKLKQRKLNADEISEHEAACGVSLPQSLKEFLSEQGAFVTGDLDQTMSILPAFLPTGERSRGLIRAIDYIWGGRPEFKQSFSQSDIDFLNLHYIVFGLRYIDDDTHVYYYFDDCGRFGILPFNQDEFDEAKKTSFDPMLKNSPATLSLDTLVSTEISLTLDSIVENFLP